MSLADQSQQWYPTSVQVTVLQARNLRAKGKNGTNDAYAIIQVAKDKFSTAVVEKCVEPEWKEEASFDLSLFHPGNAERCTLYIMVMHRALVGMDKLLGQAVINLLDLHDNKNRKKTDQKAETDNTDSLDSPLPSHTQNSVSASEFSPEASPSSDPFECFDMFSNLHSSMAPPKPERTFSDSSRVQQPPSNPGDPLKNEKHYLKNGMQFNSPTSEKSQRPSLPLPDYEALFPKKRHGVMTDTRWEHIIAEVNQRKMTVEESQNEMSVDGPVQPSSNKSSISMERNMLNLDQPQRDHQVVSSASTKGMVPKQPVIPPKPANLATTKRQLEAISEQAQERLPSVHGEKTKTDLGRNPGPSFPSQQDTRMNVKANLNPIPDPTLGQIPEPKKEKPIPTARNVKKPNSPADQSCDFGTAGLPLAKPRQGSSGKEPVRQVEPEQSVLAFTPSTSSQVGRKKEGSMAPKGLWESFKEGKPIPVNITNKTVNIPKEQPFTNATSMPEKKMTEFDPFPSDKLISHDPWALPQQSMDQDDFFSFGQKKGKKAEDQRLNSNDFDNVFGSVASKNESDPFFVPKDEANIFFDSVPSKNVTDLKQTHNSSSQKVYSQKKKMAPQPPGNPGMGKDTMDRPVIQEADDELTVNSLVGPEGGESTAASSKGRSDLFAPITSAVPEHISGSAAGGKSTLCAWVSPSEFQSGTSQSGGVMSSRRPHPVKPMSPYESLTSGSSSIGKDLKSPTIREVAEKSKSVECGPYTQLTQEELITLVVKQQTELSKKDDKIVELEDYIDNLLVRVIDEKPSILLALNGKF